MEKIKMKTPIVEMDGDEMTRILWGMIKEELLLPFIDLNTEYYDLSLPNRDKTSDTVTVDAAQAVKKYHVGVKCATITPNAKRMEEYGLHHMWKSPNGTIRSILDGTVFRTPILTASIKPFVRTWKKPITIARHAYGDLYMATEYRVPAAGKAELLFTDTHGKETFRAPVAEFDGAGVLQGSFNKDTSIRSFAQTCFRYAAAQKQDLWFAAKDTISKQYDGQFRDIFQEVYEQEYAHIFERLSIRYLYGLIDDAVARAIRSEGGFIWACKNYDGDVMSDMVSTAFGSLAMMTSILVSPDGNYEFEAAHGTITRHYYRWQKGEPVSSNPIATIYAWTGALRKRGELDENSALVSFADALDKSCLDTIEDGIMTGDLTAVSDIPSTAVSSEEFLRECRRRLERNLA